ncbi:TPA: ATP-binding cassette domain-containing protein [Neisseria meningitidis]
MIEIKNLTLQRGLKVLLDKANATVNPGQRVGLIGKNGTGKSSLFALIKGKITQDGGDVSIPKNWRLASVSQETPDLDISALDYVLQGDAELQAFQTALRQAEAQNDGMKQAEYHAKLEEIDAYTAPARAAKLLNGLGFSQEEHSRPVKSFSGGWRMRLNLAQALICRADLLLLDEPTNHLDLDMRHALTLALQSFQGALIIVSHDRSLLEATTDSFLLIDKGRLKNFDGDLNDYRQWRLAQENAAAAPAASAQSQSRKDTKRIEAQIRQEKARRGKPIQQKIDRAEKEMAQLSEIQTACEAFLAQEDAYLEANKEKLQNTLSQLAKVKTQLAQIEEVWLACQEELERIETEIEKQFAER